MGTCPRAGARPPGAHSPRWGGVKEPCRSRTLRRHRSQTPFPLPGSVGLQGELGSHPTLPWKGGARCPAPWGRPDPAACARGAGTAPWAAGMVPWATGTAPWAAGTAPWAAPSRPRADSRHRPKSRPWRRRGTGRSEAFCARRARWKICKRYINMQKEGSVSDPPPAWLCSLPRGGEAGAAPAELRREAAARDRRIGPDVLTTSSHF